MKSEPQHMHPCEYLVIFDLCVNIAIILNIRLILKCCQINTVIIYAFLSN